MNSKFSYILPSSVGAYTTVYVAYEVCSLKTVLQYFSRIQLYAVAHMYISLVYSVIRFLS